MVRKVRKALIPAAGLGTRFLPATKSVPKELLPLVDKPLLLHIAEEICDAGIEQIVMITGRGKGAIEDFFDISYELEDKLRLQSKIHWIDSVEQLRKKMEFVFIRQQEPLGLGHAILKGRSVIGDEPFAVLLGDEITVGKPNVTESLIQAFDQTQTSTVAVMEVPPEDVCKYGIIDLETIGPGHFRVRDVVEKPAVGEAPSRYALPGRYVFHSVLFDYLKETRPSKNGEIQLTDAMAMLAKNEGLEARTFQAKRYDAGDKLGFVQATIELGLEHPEIGEGLRKYLLKLLPTLK